jgi:hypothetical protein
MSGAGQMCPGTGSPARLPRPAPPPGSPARQRRDAPGIPFHRPRLTVDTHGSELARHLFAPMPHMV